MEQLAEQLCLVSRLVEEHVPVGVDLTINISYDCLWITSPDQTICVNGTGGDSELAVRLQEGLTEIIEAYEAETV